MKPAHGGGILFMYEHKNIDSDFNGRLDFLVGAISKSFTIQISETEIDQVISMENFEINNFFHQFRQVMGNVIELSKDKKIEGMSIKEA